MEKIRLLQESDIVIARCAIRELADSHQFSVLAKTQIAAAVGELSRNTIIHGGGGYMEYEVITRSGIAGLKCRFVDKGPGLDSSIDKEFSTEEPASELALMGHGLLAVRYLVDDFDIESKKGKGTSVTVVKWSGANEF